MIKSSFEKASIKKLYLFVYAMFTNMSLRGFLRKQIFILIPFSYWFLLLCVPWKMTFIKLLLVENNIESMF